MVAPPLNADNLSVVIPTFNSCDQLQSILNQIFSCERYPSAILIHVDAGDLNMHKMLEEKFSGKVRWICASSIGGPGGGRNVE